MKWEHLFEAEDEIRNLERSYKSHPSPEALLNLLKAKCRVGRDSVCARATEPTSASQWAKFVALYGGELSREPGPGDRYFDLIFPTFALREFFLEATQHLNWLNYSVHRDHDTANKFTVSIHTARGIRGPRLSRLDFTFERLEWDDPLVRGTQYYHLPRAVSYRIGARTVRHIIGAGTRDDVDLFRLSGSNTVYVLSMNPGLGYVGLSAYEDGEEAGDIFLDHDQQIEEMLGPLGLNLPDTQIVRRLINHL